VLSEFDIMDLAFDHIQDANARESNQSSDGTKQDQPQSTLNDDLQDAYKAISESAWGARIGGFFGNVVKQVSMKIDEYRGLG
jgi:hypothetical protein